MIKGSKTEYQELVEEETPLTEMPAELEALEEEDIPQATMPAEASLVLDEVEVPMAMIPKTGDISTLWMVMAALSGSGLTVLSLLKRKDAE